MAVIAEGVALDISQEDLAGPQDVERDSHGHLRIAEVNLGEILKAKVTARLRALGVKTTIAAKNIGYELRCADPISFDMEYARDLGYCAAKYLIAEGTGTMISMQGGHFVPVPFAEMTDPETGRAKVRLVDITSTRYAIARRYMIRLRKDDFDDPQELARLATTVGLSPADFRKEFEYLMADEPPPLAIDERGERAGLSAERTEEKGDRTVPFSVERRRARTDDQLVRQRDRGRRRHAPAQDAQQQPHRAVADVAHRLRDRRERRVDVARKPDVVESHDRQMTRHSDAAAPRRVDHADRHLVAEAEDRGRRLGMVEQLLGRREA